jgi:hypothetical protein
VTAIVADGFTRSSAADRNGIIVSRLFDEKMRTKRDVFLKRLRCSGKQKSTGFPHFCRRRRAAGLTSR